MSNNRFQQENLNQDSSLQQKKEQKNRDMPTPGNDNRPHSCGTCKANGKTMKDQCQCYAGGNKIGKSGAGSGEQDKSKNNEASNTPANVTTAKKLFELVNKPNPNTVLKKDEKKLIMTLDKKFDPSIIAALLEQNLLAIYPQADIGKLTIEWHPEFFASKGLSLEIKLALVQFINAIEKELISFMQQQGVPSSDVTIADTARSFSITFRDQNKYDKFYAQLEKNVFSACRNIENKHDHVQSENTNRFNPTPLKTTYEPR